MGNKDSETKYSQLNKNVKTANAEQNLWAEFTISNQQDKTVQITKPTNFVPFEKWEHSVIR